MVVIMAVDFIATMPSCGVLVTQIVLLKFIIGALRTAKPCLDTSQMETFP
jgi:hypothetical protein